MGAVLKRVLALVVACGSLFATEPSESTRRWWSYTEALANDKREGRDTGSAGYRAAEDYVITHFRTAGLIPAGTDGFRQPVSLHSAKLNPAASKVEIVRKSGDTPRLVSADYSRTAAAHALRSRREALFSGK